MNDSFWSKVASLWAKPIDPNEKAQHEQFLDNLPKEFGHIDERLISDDIDDEDIEDW